MRTTSPCAENILGFLIGPLTGTNTPLAGRFTVVKSPLTGTWGDANAGGHFGPQLRQAGCDATFLVGRSGRPVYLWLKDGQAELRPAQALWGLDTCAVEDCIRQELQEPKAQVCATVRKPASARGRPALLMTSRWAMPHSRAASWMAQTVSGKSNGSPPNVMTERGE